jgi:uncharacterized protein (TIGR02145 family)
MRSLSLLIPFAILLGCKAEDEITNPCLGSTQIIYEGKAYNIVEIGSHCWMKENLDVGTMIDSNVIMGNNGLIEKYCYHNKIDSCTKYGGLYQWDEMMQYSTTVKAQGICPPGWHIPSDGEWKVLEGTTDSEYGIGNHEWDINWEWRGFNAGANLKATIGWNENGNGTDLFGFSGMPGGYLLGYGYFYEVGNDGAWWTSTESVYSSAWYRSLSCDSQGVYRCYDTKGDGFSIRCIRDH